MAKDKLVYCKTCGAQIAKSAKKCPSCGAKQKKKHTFRNLVLLVFIGIIAYYIYSNGLHKKVKEQVNDLKDIATTFTQKEEDTKETEKPRQEETQKQTEANAAAPATEKQPETQQASSGTDTGGVSPDFKEFMDSYEEFMNEYCDFMASYDQSDATAMLKYASLMTKYADFASKVEGYNESNLSSEDYKYYVDVMARVDKKLIDTSVTVGE